MKKLIIILIPLLLLTTPVIAADKWTTQDKALEIIWLGLHAVDYGQTLDIADKPIKYYEINPLLGNHPSRNTVHFYMLSTAILHPIIAHFLPRNYKVFGFDIHPRTVFQSISIGVSGGVVVSNYNIGLNIAF